MLLLAIFCFVRKYRTQFITVQSGLYVACQEIRRWCEYTFCICKKQQTRETAKL